MEFYNSVGLWADGLNFSDKRYLRNYVNMTGISIGELVAGAKFSGRYLSEIPAQQIADMIPQMRAGIDRIIAGYWSAKS